MDKKKKLVLLIAAIAVVLAAAVVLCVLFLGGGQENILESDELPWNYDYTNDADYPHSAAITIDGSLDEAVWQDQGWYQNTSYANVNGDMSVFYVTSTMDEYGIYLASRTDDRYISTSSVTPTAWWFYISAAQRGNEGHSVVHRIMVDLNGGVQRTMVNVQRAYQVQGEPNSGNAEGATMEIFISWKALGVDVSQGLPAYFGLEMKYDAVQSDGVSIGTYSSICSEYNITSRFFRFNENGYINADADDAIIGDTFFGLGKSAGWDLTNIANNSIECIGDARNRIFFKEYGTTFLVETTIIPISALGSEPWPRAGVLFQDAGGVYHAVLMDTYDGILVDGLNGTKNMGNSHIITISNNDGGWNQQGPKGGYQTNPLATTTEGTKLTVLKDGGRIYYFVNDQFFYAEYLDYMDNEMIPGLMTIGDHCIFKDYSCKVLDREQIDTYLAERKVHPVTVKASGGGTAEVSEIFAVDGGSYDLKITSKSGYTVSSILINGVERIDDARKNAVDGVYTVKNVTSAQVVEVKFEKTDESTISGALSFDAEIQDRSATVVIDGLSNPLLHYEIAANAAKGYTVTLPSGKYRVSVTKEDCMYTEATVTVDGEATVDLEILPSAFAWNPQINGVQKISHIGAWNMKQEKDGKISTSYAMSGKQAPLFFKGSGTDFVIEAKIRYTTNFYSGGDYQPDLFGGFVFNDGSNEAYAMAHTSGLNITGFRNVEGLTDYLMLMNTTKLTANYIFAKCGNDVRVYLGGVEVYKTTWEHITNGLIAEDAEVIVGFFALMDKTSDIEFSHYSVTFGTQEAKKYINNFTPKWTTVSSLAALNYETGLYRLSKDISANSTTVKSFAGTLDGNEHTVNTSVPLFENLPGAKVKNLTINLTKDLTAEGLLAKEGAKLEITNVHTTASPGAELTAPEGKSVGGLIGSTYLGGESTFKNCSNAVPIVSTQAEQATGGLVGSVEEWNTTFINCVNNSTVSGQYQVGGIVGSTNKYNVVFENCINNGTVNSEMDGGGILGFTMWAEEARIAALRGCINNGTVNAQTAGGIVGSVTDGFVRITQCVNNGTVNGTGEANRAGGILGTASNNGWPIIEGCSSTAAASVSADDAGGIMGSAAGVGNIVINGCTNDGSVCGDDHSGGILGYGIGVGKEFTLGTYNGVGNTNSGHVTGGDGEQPWAGGIVGGAFETTFTVNNAVNNGIVDNAAVSGGIVGFIYKGEFIANGCQNNGTVEATNSSGDIYGARHEAKVVIDGIGGNNFDEGTANELEDKLVGGWVGQMVGVDRGFPNEFTNNASLVPDDEIKALLSSDVSAAFHQDDLYVEIPFLEAMEKYGYDCDGSYLADTFKNSTFGLWHANLWGRTNLQNGISYPNSGSYLYNQCAEDIDWQIESDFLGMMYPGMPSEAAARAFELGHIMNYGDGVYGGVFVAAMHAQSYTATSLDQIWKAGVQAIPEGTQFRSLLEDVIANYNNGMSFEDNWAAINAKWISTALCFDERNGCTIDAKLNAGYVLLAMLYGFEEDGLYNQMDKATYYAIKCGMDADCNASTVASLLGSYYGYEALKAEFGFDIQWYGVFATTDMTLQEAIELNIRLMYDVLQDNGYQADANGNYQLPSSQTIVPVPFEQVPDGAYAYLNNLSAVIGKTVRFDKVVFRYKNAEVVSYKIDFGDGYVYEGEDYLRIYTYAEDGTYTISFTVIDSLGGHNTTTLKVVIDEASVEYTPITDLSQITDLAGNYCLETDIVGNSTTVSGFTGNLNGKGYSISTSVPLFEALNGATVENLKIELTGNMTAQGTLASSAANATITGVTVIGNGYTLTGSENAPVGGLVGTAQYTTFTDCSSSVNVTAVGTGSAGGILGATSADEIFLCCCSNEGTVTAANASAGGILGDAKSNKVKLYGCSNSGTVSTSGGYKGAGGIVGEAYWANGTEDSIYIGNAGDTVTTNTGAVSGYCAGGIVGYAHDGAYLTVENAVNKGTVTDGSRTAQDTRVGGIVGFANSSNSNVKLNNCTNEGAVSGGIVGGILGHAAEATVTITGGSNSGLVTGEEYLGAGGIVGRVDGSNANVTISGATNKGTVRGYSYSDWRIGGIIGYHTGNATAKIDSCTNTGTIYGTIIGGMVGQSENAYLTVTNSTSEGPIAGMNNRFAGGIVGLANGDVGSATITGNTITAYITNTGDAAWQIGNIMVATNTVSGNTESGTVFQNCAGATEITAWDQITDMWGTYILAADITTNGTTYDFHGRLYGAGHTIRTATTLFGSTNNAQFSVQDLNVVLTKTLQARSVLVFAIQNSHETVRVTIKNVTMTAENGAILKVPSGGSYGSLAGQAYNTDFINCNDQIPVEDLEGVAYWDRFGASTAAERYNTYRAEGTDGVTTIVVGDSFFDPVFWSTFEQDFEGKDALCLGIGGSTAEDWLNYIAEGIFLHNIQPKNVVFNLGNNDIHNDQVLNTYLDNMQHLLNTVHELMPDAKLYLFSVAHRSGAGTNAMVDEANALMQAWCAEQGSWVAFIDISDELNTSMLFDGIHPYTQYYSSIYVPALLAAGCELEDKTTEVKEPEAITSLDQITDKRGNYYLTGNITGNTITVSSFAGTLDGNGYTITTSVPLFEALNGATVEKLEIKLTGNMTDQGALAATAIGATISNVSVTGTGTLTAPEGKAVGALVGEVNGTKFTSCSNAITVIGNEDGYAGGLVGAVTSPDIVFTDCVNSSAVTGGNAGGILGLANKINIYFYGCSNSGKITATVAGGGILAETLWVGEGEGIVIGASANGNTTNTGNVTAQYAGGMIGCINNGSIVSVDGAVNSGAIQGNEIGDYRAGGIIGYIHSNGALPVTITNCTNKGALEAMITGGILGHAAEATVTITGGSNSGLVTGEDYLGAGGIVGRVDGSNANVTISGATNKGTVRGYSYSDWRIGGIIGYHTGNATAKIDSCTNTGTIYGTIIGGMVGQSENAYLTVTNSTSEGPIAGMNNRFAGGIVGLANGDVGSATITGNTITAYITNTGTSAWQIGNISVSTNTVSGNTESGTVFQNCAGATEITAWDQITDMWGTYILTSDITTNGTTYDFHGRLYGAGHTIYTATTLFGTTNNAQFSVQDLNVVLTADLIANSVLVNTIDNNHETVMVTIRNVNLSAENEAMLIAPAQPAKGALAAYAANTSFVNCTDTVPVEVREVEFYTITYKGLEGANNPNPTSYPQGANTALAEPGDREGYTFLGWFIGAEEITSLEGRTGDLVIVARWVKNGSELPDVSA